MSIFYWIKNNKLLVLLIILCIIGAIIIGISVIFIPILILVIKGKKYSTEVNLHDKGENYGGYKESNKFRIIHWGNSNCYLQSILNVLSRIQYVTDNLNGDNEIQRLFTGCINLIRGDSIEKNDVIHKLGRKIWPNSYGQYKSIHNTLIRLDKLIKINKKYKLIVFKTNRIVIDTQFIYNIKKNDVLLQDEYMKYLMYDMNSDDIRALAYRYLKEYKESISTRINPPKTDIIPTPIRPGNYILLYYARISKDYLIADKLSNIIIHDVKYDIVACSIGKNKHYTSMILVDKEWIFITLNTAKSCSDKDVLDYINIIGDPSEIDQYILLKRMS
jgi:hypothetical protein